MDKRAFTLVELIAVITILGVILMIAVPSYNRYIEKSEKTQCEADKKAIEDAAKTFINDCIYNNKCKDNKDITQDRNVNDLIENNFLNSKYLKYGDKTITRAIDNYEVSVNIQCP